MTSALPAPEQATRHIMMATILRASIAMQIRQLRESRGVTQEALAQGIGSHQSNISAYECPTGDWMSVATLVRIAKFFDVALHVSFASWSDFIDANCLGGGSMEAPQSFEQENARE